MPSAIEAAKAAGEPVKFCAGCARWLPLGAYAARKDRPGGISSRCKDCRNRQTRAWHARHPTYAGEYARAHPERQLAYHERQVARLRALIESNEKPT